MFGRNKGDKPDLECWATYCGGHKAYPDEHTCKLKIFADRIEITKPEIKIPFAVMNKVEYTKTPKIGVTGVGTRTFSIVEYNDGIEMQQVVILIVDQLGSRNLEKAHGMMYSRMLEAKQQKS